MHPFPATFHNWNELQKLNAIVAQVGIHTTTVISIVPIHDHEGIKRHAVLLEQLHGPQHCCKRRTALLVVAVTVMQLGRAINRQAVLTVRWCLLFRRIDGVDVDPDNPEEPFTFNAEPKAQLPDSIELQSIEAGSDGDSEAPAADA